MYARQIAPLPNRKGTRVGDLTWAQLRISSGHGQAIHKHK